MPGRPPRVSGGEGRCEDPTALLLFIALSAATLVLLIVLALT